MASPQTEDGYTRIANELYDALIRTRIPGEQRQVFDFIIRKTYGWGKTMDVISISQFVEATKIDKSNVCRALRALVKRRLVVKKDNREGASYGPQKDYAKWKLLSKKTTVVKADTKSLSKKTHTKETLTKERKSLVHSPELQRSFDAFWEEYPVKKGKKKAFAKWKKLSPDNGLTEQIMAGLSQAKSSRQWKKDNGEFIEHPATWLNGERWNDEHTEGAVSEELDF